MVDTNWGDFTDRNVLLATDKLLVADAAGGGVNVPGDALLRKDENGAVAEDVQVGTSQRAISQMILASGNGQGHGTTVLGRRGGTLSWAFGDLETVSGQPGQGFVAYVFGGAAMAVFASALRPLNDAGTALGSGSYRFSTVYAATSAISTSDENEKTEIEAIPDAWLDAWAAVDWVRYKFKDSVAEKGEGARWHTGLVAQRVHAAFAAQGIDAFAIGLVGRDTWGEETRQVMADVPKTKKVTKPVMVEAGEVNGAPVYRLEQAAVDESYTEREPTGEVEIVRSAGERWNLRYDECQAIEAAYQRRRANRLEETVTALVARVDAIEAAAA